MGAGETFDDGILHIILVLRGLHRGLSCQNTFKYFADSITCRHFLVVVGVLHVT